MKFKYNGKIYNPVNIEKKLKKMGITMGDIEILPDEKKKDSPTGIEDYMQNKERVIICSTQDNIRRVCFVPIGTRPPIKEFLGKQGIYSDEQLENMYYEK